MKTRLAIFLCLLYGMASIAFTIFFGNNFSDYHFRFKGDDIFFFIEVLFGADYLFLLIFQFSIKRINFFLFLFLPLSVCVFTVFLGLIIMLLIGLGGTPKETILTYGFTHTVVTLYIAYILWIFRRGMPIKKIL